MEGFNTVEELVQLIKDGLAQVASGSPGAAVLPSGRFRQLVEPARFRAIIYGRLPQEVQDTLPQTLPELMEDERFISMAPDLLAGTLQRASKVLQAVQSKAQAKGSPMPDATRISLWPAMVREAFGAELAKAMEAAAVAQSALTRRLEASGNIARVGAGGPQVLAEEEASTLMSAGWVQVPEVQGGTELAGLVGKEATAAVQQGAVLPLGEASTPGTPDSPLQPGSSIRAAAVPRKLLEGSAFPALQMLLQVLRDMPGELNALEATGALALLTPLPGTTSLLSIPCAAGQAQAGAAVTKSSALPACPVVAGECLEASCLQGQPAGAAWLRDTLDVRESVSGQAPSGGADPESKQRDAVLASAQQRAALGAVVAVYWPWGGDAVQGGVVLHPTSSSDTPCFVPAEADSMVLVHTQRYAVQIMPAVGADEAALPVVMSWFHPSLLFTKATPPVEAGAGE